MGSEKLFFSSFQTFILAGFVRVLVGYHLVDFLLTLCFDQIPPTPLVEGGVFNGPSSPKRDLYVSHKIVKPDSSLRSE
jgi:hypothetical protein